MIEVSVSRVSQGEKMKLYARLHEHDCAEVALRGGANTSAVLREGDTLTITPAVPATHTVVSVWVCDVLLEQPLIIVEGESVVFECRKLRQAVPDVVAAWEID